LKKWWEYIKDFILPKGQNLDLLYEAHKSLVIEISKDFTKAYKKFDGYYIDTPFSEIPKNVKKKDIINPKITLEGTSFDIKIKLTKRNKVLMQINDLIIKKIREISSYYAKKDYKRVRDELKKTKLRKDIERYSKNKELAHEESIYLKLLYFNLRIGTLHNFGYFVETRYDIESLEEIFQANIDYFRSALLCSQETNNLEVISVFWDLYRNLMFSIRDIWIGRRKIESAHTLYLDTLDFVKKSINVTENNWKHYKISMVKKFIGDMYLLVDDFTQAKDAYEKVESKLMEIMKCDAIYQILITQSLAHLDYKMSKIDDAYIKYLKVLSLIKKAKVSNEKKIELEAINYQHIAGMKSEQRKYIESLTYYEKAIEKTEKLVKYNNPDFLEFKARLYYNCSMTYIFLKQYNLAKIILEKAYEIIIDLSNKFTRIYSDLTVNILGELIRILRYEIKPDQLVKYIDDYENMLQLQEDKEIYSPLDYMKVLGGFGILCIDLGDLEKSEKYLVKAFESYEKLSPENQKLPHTKVNLGIIHQNYGRVEFLRKNYLKAEFHYKTSIELFDENPELKGYESHLVMSLSNLANIYSNLKRFEFARSIHDFCKEIREILFDQNNDVYAKDYIGTLNDKGVFHHETKEYNLALVELKKSLELSDLYLKMFEERYKKQYPGKELVNTPFTEIKAKTLDAIGLVYHKKRDYDTALDYFERSLSIRKNLYELNPAFYSLQYASTLNNLHLIYRIKNELEKSEKYISEAIIITQKLIDKGFNNYNIDLAIFIRNSSILNLTQKKYERCQIDIAKSYKALQKIEKITSDFEIERSLLLMEYSILIENKPEYKLDDLPESVDIDKLIHNVERRAGSERYIAKNKIEILYNYQLINEIKKLKDKPVNSEKIERVVNLIQVLRSGNFLLIDQPHVNSKKSEYDDINLIRGEISKCYHDIKNLLKPINTSMLGKYLSKKSKIHREIISLEQKGLESRSKQLEKKLELNSNNLEELLIKYFKQTPKHSFFFIHTTNNDSVLIFIDADECLVDIVSNKLIDIGNEIRDNLGKLNSIVTSEDSNEIQKEIEKLSNRFWEIIPKNISEKMINSKCILFSLCSLSQGIPFELLKDKDELELGLKVETSRIFSLQHYISDILFNKTNSTNLETLLIINPKTSEGDLPLALVEGRELKANLENKSIQVNYLESTDAIIERIEPLLSNELQLIHFASHGNPNEILLSHDQKFSVALLRKNISWFEYKPIIFLNTCQTGTTEYFGGGRFTGLIPELMRSNSGPIIASRNSLFDNDAMNFSKTFYEYMLLKNNIGEALLKTRKKYADNKKWANYVLYGNANKKLEF